MIVIFEPYPGSPPIQMQCSCGEKFWVDPADEENLEFNGSELVEVCPKCGLRNPDKKI
jgi:hypothetical protein